MWIGSPAEKEREGAITRFGQRSSVTLLDLSLCLGSHQASYNRDDDEHDDGDDALLPADGLLYLDGLHHLLVACVDVVRGFLHLRIEREGEKDRQRKKQCVLL